MKGSTAAKFFYLEWNDKFKKEKPYYLYMDAPEGLPVSNFTTKEGPVEMVQNLRGIESHFSLDDNGFAVRHQDFCLETIDHDTVTKYYLPSLEVLLKDEFGQKCDIVWFDWRTRSSNSSIGLLPEGTRVRLDDRAIDLKPVQSVHVGLDQSKNAAIKRVHLHTGDRASDLLKGRVRIIKPCADPVVCDPLAVMDGGTIPAEKLVEVDVVRQSYVGEAYYPLQHDGYKWYFIDKQRKEDVLIFKMYDSSDKVDAKCCPHASFSLAESLSKVEPRQSIEVADGNYLSLNVRSYLGWAIAKGDSGTAGN